MAALDVVEVVDVVADRLRRSFSGRVTLVVDEFCSERCKKTLGDGVVQAVALTAHAATHPLGSQLGAVVVTGVRASAVRVMKQPGWRLPGTKSLSQDVEREFGIVAVAGCPTHKSTRVEVKHRRQLAGRDGCHVRHPRTIRLGHAELPSE